MQLMRDTTELLLVNLDYMSPPYIIARKEFLIYQNIKLYK